MFYKILYLMSYSLIMISFEDANTPYMSAKDITNLVEYFEDFAWSIFQRSANNQMSGNVAKCHVLCHIFCHVIFLLQKCVLIKSKPAHLKSYEKSLWTVNHILRNTLTRRLVNVVNFICSKVNSNLLLPEIMGGSFYEF